MKSEKGITLITLSITIILMMIMTFTLTVNMAPYKEQTNKKNFETDIEVLNEEITQYYARTKELPVVNKYNDLEMITSIKNANDNDIYYVIDLKALDVKLNNGADYSNILAKGTKDIEKADNVRDVYIINEQSHTIYYPAGVEYGGRVNYRLPEVYTKMEDSELFPTIEELKGGSYVAKATTARDSNGNKIKIPQGFKVAADSGINVTEGIVIEDNDIIDGIGNGRGNQYVWVPVGKGIKKSDGTKVNITLGRYTFADGTSDKDSNGTLLTKGTPILQQNSENYTQETAILNTGSSYGESYKELATYREGVESMEQDAANTTTRGKAKSDGTYEGLKSFIDSVNANGGYYIARYEASYGTDGKPNSKVSNTVKSSSTAPTTEGQLWNNISQKNAAAVSMDLYTTMTTDLINSYAWDTAIVYIQNFSENTEYSYKSSSNTSLTNTGTTGDEVCKINDMASNTREWTTEYTDYNKAGRYLPCIVRGGDIYSAVYTSTRVAVSTFTSDDIKSFRVILY